MATPQELQNPILDNETSAAAGAPIDSQKTVNEPLDSSMNDETANRKEQEADVTERNGLKTENTDINGMAKGSQIGVFAKIYAKLSLDIPTVLMMLKGSIPPLIGIAWYQSSEISDLFSTIGYLVPIVSILSLCIMPRAKYIQTLIFNILGICVGAAIALLGLWSAVQARLHTAPPGSRELYNSSQSAVCAIWLFANIYFVNVLRAKIPALQFPVIIYSIFTDVAFTFGPFFPSTDAAEILIRKLLIAFLSAFALSTGVSLFIFPVSSRKVLQKELAAFLEGARGALKAQTAYLASLESSDMFATIPTSLDDTNNQSMHKKKKPKQIPIETTHSKSLKGAVSGLLALFGKIHGDMPLAKREIAFRGKLTPKDYDAIFDLFRGILIPLVGMSTVSDVFERIAEKRGWLHVDASLSEMNKTRGSSDEESKIAEKKIWNDIMKVLHESFSLVSGTMDEGLEHAGLILEMLPKPKKRHADEEFGGELKPGHPEFGSVLKSRLLDFYSKRGEVLKIWASEKGLTLDGASSQDLGSSSHTWANHTDKQQLYLILYMEHLLYSAGIAVEALIKFADSKVADGTMKKSRLILPGQRRIKKWILNIGREDATIDNESPDSLEANSHHIYMGAGFAKSKDPEHLPPRNAWQHFGNGVRTIPRFLRSPESAFGFRVACATLTIGIVAYLKDTQKFFMEQRLVWAMIIISIGMSLTSGQSVFGFFGRVTGTFLATVSSYVIWYIVDQKTAGVIVFLWLFIFLEMYLFLKVPRFLPIWLVTIVTQVLIIGYELQVRKIGIAAASATGQPYYPVYTLAPYRLACVAGGSFVAFIWTIFPHPISDRSWLRKDLGNTLYLLANYYSIVHSTVTLRLHGREGNPESKISPGRQIAKIRFKVFAKIALLLPSLQAHAEWQKWEPSLGGDFPRDTYEGIVLRSRNIMNYLSLTSYATEAWSSRSTAFFPDSNPATSRAWLNDLATLVDSIHPTSHRITSILSILSASVREGMALPPQLDLPQSFDLDRRLMALDPGIMSARHLTEPGYSTYAVLQIVSSLIVDDLAKLVGHVKELVGETDFSFKFADSDASFDTTVSHSSLGKGKAD